MTWFSVELEQAPNQTYVWVRTRDGIIATGFRDGPWWSADGFRILDHADEITHWATIEYPEFE